MGRGRDGSPVTGLVVRLIIVTLASLALIGCGSTARVTPSPEPAATSRPAATAPPTNDNATMTALAIDNIVSLYSDADWYASVHQVDGKPDVSVDGTTMLVGVTLEDTAAGRATAKTICAAIALAAFDANGDPIGFRHVHLINGADVELADCDTRT